MYSVEKLLGSEEMRDLIESYLNMVDIVESTLENSRALAKENAILKAEIMVLNRAPSSEVIDHQKHIDGKRYYIN